MIFLIGGAHQGKTEYVREKYGAEYKVMDDYHLVVKEQLNSGRNPIAEAEKMLTDSFDKLVIISNELGCGIVPSDSFQREYREVNGRVNCMLAKEAEQVIRVICGIGNRIK